MARFIVDVITQLDLGALYAHYGPRGGEAIAPDMLLGLLFYGYATGTFRARKIARATYESMPFHLIVANTLSNPPNDQAEAIPSASTSGTAFDTTRLAC